MTRRISTSEGVFICYLGLVAYNHPEQNPSKSNLMSDAVWNRVAHEASVVKRLSTL